MRPPIKLSSINSLAAFTSKYKAQSTLTSPMLKVCLSFLAQLRTNTT